MFCNKCGKNLPDGARFCDGCGNNLYTAQPQQPVYQPVYQPVAQPIRPPVHYTQAPTVLDVDCPSVSALKNLAKSPLVLFLAIALSASLVIGLLNALGAISNYMGVLRSLLRELNADDVMDILSMLEGSMTTSTVMGYLLPALFALGVWLTYFAGFKKKGMSTAGLTAMKVFTTINMVSFCIVAGVTALIMGLIMMGMNNVEEVVDVASFDMVNGILGVLLVFLLACAALVIVFYARAIGTINAAKEIATTGKTRKKASVYVAVICFVAAVSTISSAMSMMSTQNMLKNYLPEEAYEILKGLDLTGSALPTLLSGVAMLLLGILIFNYRSKVQPLAEYMDTPVAVIPVVPVAPVAPVAEPVAEEPVAEEPVAEEPIVEEPIVEEPIVEEPVVEEPIVEEPIVEEPIVEEPIAEESIVEEPVAEEPAVEAAALVAAEPEFVFCAACGKKVLAAAKFCPYCGSAK